MQDNKKYLNKGELKTIFDARPDLDRVKILDSFLERGFIIEGYNDAPPKKQANIVQKIADTTIGGAVNIGNTVRAYGEASGDWLGQRLTKNEDKSFSENFENASERIKEDTSNVNQTIIGRDTEIRDLSKAEDIKKISGDALSTLATVAPGGASLKGASLGTKVVQGAKIGAGVGALAGAGQSMQDGDNLGDVAKETFTGGAVGLAVGGALPVVSAGIKKGAEITKKSTGKIFTTTKDSIGSIKYNHINPQVSQSATRLAENKIEPNKLYSQFKNAQEVATLDVKKPSALEIVGNDIGDAFDDVVAKRKEVGKLVGAELQKIGNTKMQIDEVVSPYAKNIMGEFKKVATGKQSKFSTDEIEMLSKFDLELKTLGKNPTADDIGNFLTRIRSEINSLKGKKNIMGVTNADRLMTEVTANLNKKLAENFPAYASAKSEYARLSDLLEEGVGYLGKKTISGDYKKETSIVKSSLNSILNGGKKDFLVQLEKETNKPILDKAVVAGQVMKDLGDARGESLLQKLTDESIKGKGYKQIAVEWLGDKVLGDESSRTKNYLSDFSGVNNSKINANKNMATGIPTYQINKANNIPPAISNINISGIIAQSPKKAKEVLKGLISQLPTATKNALIKELTNQVNE